MGLVLSRISDARVTVAGDDKVLDFAVGIQERLENLLIELILFLQRYPTNICVGIRSTLAKTGLVQTRYVR